MTIRLAMVVLCLSSASTAEGAATSEAEEAPPQEAYGPDDAFEKPPPGSPMDQALWKAASEVDNAIPMSRGESARLQWRVRQGQFNERLEQLEKSGPPEKAKLARETAVKMLAIRDKNYEIITRKWPIDPTRVCSYQLLEFTSALTSGKGPSEKAQQDAARTALKACVDKALLVLKSMERSNEELAAALASLDAELPPGTPVTGPAGVPPAVPEVPFQAPRAATGPAGSKGGK